MDQVGQGFHGDRGRPEDPFCLAALPSLEVLAVPLGLGLLSVLGVQSAGRTELVPHPSFGNHQWQVVLLGCMKVW